MIEFLLVLLCIGVTILVAQVESMRERLWDIHALIDDTNDEDDGQMGLFGECK